MANEVKVRLSAEGVGEVVAAFRKVEAEAARTQSKSGKVFAGLKNQVADLGRLLPALGAAGAVAGLVKLTKVGLDAADSVGKLSQKVGASTENLSALQFAASTADVTNEQLSKGLVILTKNLTNLRDGGEDAADAFGRIGLAAADFTGKDTVESFDLIAQRLSKIPDQASKTAATLKIFGKAGADLIPLLNDVGREGFDNLRAKAQELGLVIDQETAAAAQAANDSFTVIGQQAKGLAIQFASGFAPVIAETMQAFTDDTKGKGAGAMREFGQKTARVIVTIINVFRLLGNVVGGVMGGIGRQLGGFAAAANALFSGNFREAARIWKLAGEDGRKDFAAFKAQFGKDIDRLVADATRDPKKFALKPGVDTSAIEDVETAAEKAAKDRAAKELERAAEAAQRKAEAEAREQEQLQSQREGFEQKLLELQGQRHAAAMAALEDELKQYDEILKKQGVNDSERTAAVEKYRTAALAQLTAQEKLAEGERVLAELARERQDIENRVALGKTDEKAAVIELTALEQTRLVTLQAIAAAALAAAEATGDTEAIDAARALTQEVQNLQVEIAKTPQGFIDIKEAANDAAGAGLDTLFNAAIEGAGTFRDVAKAALMSVVGSIQQVLLEAIKLQILKKIMSFGAGFAEGGAVRAAGGGAISGPGTATSDSIPAWLSNGEVVIKAASAGPNMAELLHLNKYGRWPGLNEPRVHFAKGGAVDTGGGGGGEPQQERPIRIVNYTDPAMAVEAMASSDGERVIMNFIRRNKRGISSMLKG